MQGGTFKLKKKDEEKESPDMRKYVGLILAAAIASYIISLGIKYIRGVDAQFLGLYLIVFAITFPIMFFLSRKKK